jgi:hypothetical protein
VQLASINGSLLSDLKSANSTENHFGCIAVFAPLTTAELKEKAFFVYKNEHFFVTNSRNSFGFLSFFSLFC